MPKQRTKQHQVKKTYRLAPLKKDEKAEGIAAAIRNLNARYAFIDSTASVVKHLKEEQEIIAKPKEVRTVMRQELDMRYRKVKDVSLHANSQKNLVLRQQFALELIKVFQEGKIILNLDETWLGMTDFRRMKWRTKGSTNSVAKKALVPRVSMLVGLDTMGNVYLSLYQSNTNNKLIEILLLALVKKLDQERSAWRKDTVILWDYATYHGSASTLKLIKDLRIPILFTGPHSYDASPCELWFAHFKRADVNPRQLKTGKR